MPSQPKAAAAAAAPRRLFGRYVLLDRLGSGGFGIVWAAYDPELDRKVAVKLLREEIAGSDEAQVRLVREARAMARLGHPNVVAVHDVGTADGQVFIASELVHGGTLVDWLRARRRPWREIVAALVDAGRGLAAAHAAGLIHRDFKPHNVLVADDGRVRVSDFGLARAAAGVDTDPPRPVGSTPSGRTDDLVTRTGAAMGTPAYMAPEQHRGLGGDARADQFSFCVTAYEALYGERPFRADETKELPPAIALALEATEGRVRAAPADSDVPGWLRAVLLRGLAPDPERRWPSMPALLDALGRDPWARRRRLLVGAGALLAMVGLGAVAVQLSGRRAALCTGAAERLAGVWDAPARERAHAGLLASGSSYAPVAWGIIEPSLDRWSERWVAMRGEACRATRIRGEQSEQALDLRIACLDRHLDELRALGAALERIEASSVDAAVPAARRLASIDECADVDALARGVRPPADPDLRRRAEIVAARLRDVSTALNLSRPEVAEAMAAVVLAAARHLGHPPLAAEADQLDGQLHLTHSDLPGAARLFESALWGAEAVGDDHLKLMALDGLIDAARESSRYDEANRWLAAMEATVQRRGGLPAERAIWLRARAFLFASQGNYEAALAAADQAFALIEGTPGARDIDVAAYMVNVAVRSLQRGDHERGRGLLRRALAVFEAELGPEHPLVGRILTQLGISFYVRGELAAAHEPLERAIAISERAYGPGHASQATTLETLGLVVDAEGRHAEARALLERALAIAEKANGARSVTAVKMLVSLANSVAAGGDRPGAIALYRRALVLEDELLGPKHPDAAIARANLAMELRLDGQPAEALTLLDRALPVLDGGADPMFAAFTRTEIGLCHLALGQPAHAIPPLERSVAFFAAGGSHDPEYRAAAEAALAHALWESGRDRRRALALARAAVASYESGGPGGAAGAATEKAWLAARE